MLLMTSFPIVVTKLGKSKEGAGEWAVSSKCEINPMRLTHIFKKGQLISRCLFGVFNFSKKTNNNKWTGDRFFSFIF